MLLGLILLLLPPLSYPAFAVVDHTTPQIVTASTLDELYSKLGWDMASATDQKLADFMYSSLKNTGYKNTGYGTIQQILDGDIQLLKNLSKTSRSGLKILAVPENGGIAALTFWYPVNSSPSALVPPAQQAAAKILSKIGEKAGYFDWLIVNPSTRHKGVGRYIFASTLKSIRDSGLKYWFARTIFPENKKLYETLYHQQGKADIIAKWNDGRLTRVAFLGNLEGKWLEKLVKTSKEKTCSEKLTD